MNYQKPGRKQHVTMRGTVFDMSGFSSIDANRSITAVTGQGSMVKMNGNGDVLGRGGSIVKTRDEIEAGYNTEPQGVVKKVTLKNIQPDDFETPQEALKRLSAESKPTEPPKVDRPASVVPKDKIRRLVDKQD